MTHPLGFSHSEPSVAALVGSLDRDCGQFASHVWLQGHRIEMLQARIWLAQRSFLTSCLTAAATSSLCCPAWLAGLLACTAQLRHALSSQAVRRA